IRGTVDAKAVRKATRELINRYGGEINPRELAPELQELWDGIGTGKNLNWEDIHAKAKDIAQRIAESSIERDDTMYRDFAELRKYCRENTFTISEIDRNNIPDFNDFRKMNMGRMRIAYGKTDIDRHYRLLEEMYPGMFDENKTSNPADQLLQISEVLNDVYEITERSRFESHMDYAIGTIANDIIETFYEIPETKKTLKDLKIEKLERTVLERDARVQSAERTMRQYKKTAEKVLSEYNKKEHELEIEKEKFGESKEKFYEKQKEKQKRAQIIRATNRLSQQLRWETDNKHIPQELQGAVARFLECVNLTGLYTYDERGKLRKSPDGTPTKKSLDFEQMKAIYKKFDGELVFAPEFFEGVWEDGEERGNILSRVIALSDTRVAAMEEKDLDVIIKGIKIVETAIKSADTLFSNSRFREISSLAEHIRDTAPLKDRFKVRRLTSSLKQILDMDNLTPEAFFHRLGEGGDEIFRMLNKAEGKKVKIIKQAKNFCERLTDRKTRRKLEREVKTVTLGGQEIDMSVAQIMELYALQRREQAKDHLVKGGIMVEGIPGHKGEKLRDPVKATVEEIGHAIALLTDEQRKMAEHLSRFASEKLGGHMNEACRKVFGYEKFKEINYWRI
ncbi:MAG: hypothetical protein IJN97_02595, partial [Oscillospiraceae bacterium]|nr:hypothetical protein [Oscillospiraceae bacterium]